MKRSLTIIFFLHVFFLFSQSKVKHEKFDTNFVRNAKSDFCPRFFSENTVNNFVFQSPEKNKKINYTPNNAEKFGVAFNYKWFGLALGFNALTKNRDTKSKGKSDVFDVSATIYGKHVTSEVYLNFFNGMYLKNSDDFELRLPQNQFYKRRDITWASYGANIYYLFNSKRYSLRSTYAPNEIQLKSAGSFIIHPTLRVYQIRSDSSLIPVNIREDVGLEGFRVGDFISQGFQFGYGYSKVVDKHWSFNAALIPGVFVQHQTITKETGEKIEGVTIGVKNELRLSIVYNQKYLFGGVSFRNNAQTSRVADFTFSTSVTNILTWVGYRFYSKKSNDEINF